MPTNEVVIEANDAQVSGFQDWAAAHDVKAPVELPTEPKAWLAVRYPRLPSLYDPAVLMGKSKEDEDLPLVKDLSHAPEPDPQQWRRWSGRGAVGCFRSHGARVMRRKLFSAAVPDSSARGNSSIRNR